MLAFIHPSGEKCLGNTDETVWTVLNWVIWNNSATSESAQMKVMVRFRKIGSITSVNNSKSPMSVDTLPLKNHEHHIHYIHTNTYA